MVFSDLFFIFVFIPAFIVTYLIAGVIDRKVLSRTSRDIYYDEESLGDRLRHSKSFLTRNIALVIFSLIFYAWGEPVYIFLMIVCVIINYFVGIGMTSADNRPKLRKTLFILGLAANLLLLATFKYLGFFSDSLKSLGLDLDAPKLALPIGISFYIFQSISYLVDVYRRESPAQRRFLDLLLYISMFPQLIAGPIVRYGTIAEEINDRHVTAEDIADGAYRFFIGLGKKVILANMLSELADQFLAGSLDGLSVWGAWIGILAFTLQIYYDFSGYSDMAIGMGRCMGFHFNENFNHPYCCNSVTDFWRRWHMSLGSFFRDYCYIPMGGNRRHQALNLLTVWFLTGMWHGASWNFIIWGLYFGLILAIEKFTIMKHIDKIPGFLMHIYSLMIVVIGWGIFYFDNFDKMKQWFATAFGGGSLEFGLVEETALTDNFWLWIAAILLCMPIRRKIEELGAARIAGLPGGGHINAAIRGLCSVMLLLMSVALLVGATNNAFIYTRF